MNIKETLKEFKEFLFRGNILDMAIGVVVGTAFNNIVKSLVGDIIMPLIGMIGGKSVAELALTINGVDIKYGLFFQNVIDFLIIATSMFIVIKVMAALSSLHKKKEEEAVEDAPPAKSDEVVLLEEIRDLLKK